MTVTVENPSPLRIDYGDNDPNRPGPEVRIGQASFPARPLMAEGSVTVSVNLPPDQYRVEVRMPSGEWVTAPNLLRVIEDAVAKHEVRYDANGGRNPPADSRRYEAGEVVTVLDRQQMGRPGFRFEGWITKPDASGEFLAPGETFIMPARDTTLYASWEPIPARAQISFRDTPSLPLGGTVRGFRVADLDKNGLQDLIFVGEAREGGIVRLRRDVASNAGETGEAMGLTDGVHSDVELRDFDQDGDLDLFAFDESGHLTVRLDNAGGQFDGGSVPVPGPTGGSFFVEDVNGDGCLDVGAVVCDSECKLRFNVGRRADDCRFEKIEPWARGVDAHVDSWGPDAEGFMTLIIVFVDPEEAEDPPEARSNTLEVWANGGAGGFERKTQKDLGPGVVGIELADVSGDGAPELVVAFEGSVSNGELEVEAGGTKAYPIDQAGGSVGSAVTLLEQAPGVSTLRARDLDGDMQTELIVTNRTAGDLTVYKGGHGLPYTIFERFDVGKKPIQSETADVDGNGRPDILCLNAGSEDLSVLLQKRDGTFEASRALRVGILGVTSGGRRAEWTDLDGDGHKDLALIHRNSRVVSTALADGGGFFSNVWTSVVPKPSDLSTPFVSARIRDLQIVPSQDHSIPDIFVSLENRIIRLDNFGGGKFEPAEMPEFVDPVCAGGQLFLSGFLVRDFDGDDRLDLFSGRHLACFGEEDFNANVTFRFGGGTGRTSSDLRVSGKSVRDDSIRTKAFDVDRDGLLEVAAITEQGDAVVVYGVTDHQSDGPPGLTPLASLTGYGHGFTDVAFGEFSGDGVIDAVAASPASDRLVLGVGREDGGFSGNLGKQTIYVGSGSRSITSADLDEDGRSDLVVADAERDRVGVLLSEGDGLFSSPHWFRTGTEPQDVVLGDFDEDGQVDLAVVSGFHDKVSVLYNTTETP